MVRIYYAYFYSLVSGWPSFSDVAEKGNVVKIKDTSHGMVRVEVACAKVGGVLYNNRATILQAVLVIHGSLFLLCTVRFSPGPCV